MEMGSVPFRLLALLSALVTFSTSCHLAPRPSDAFMETTFRQNRKEFEQLRAFITEDSSTGKVFMVSQDRTDPDFNEAARRGLSRERLENYRRLLRLLHVRGVGRDGDDTIFQASVVGWLMKATYKGYLYTKDQPPHIETTLDDVGERKCGNLLVKPLQGYWYLYYFRDCADGQRRAGPNPHAL
jgi:hypothetical protein